VSIIKRTKAKAGGNWIKFPISTRFLISSMRHLSDAAKGIVPFESAHSKPQAICNMPIGLPR